LDEFLKSKAMLTPGVAGAMTTMITGTLVSQFGFPGNWTGLVISLLFGLTIWAEKSVAIYYRIVFYIINSLTIYAVAIGVNTAGMAITYNSERISDSAPVVRMVPTEQDKFFQDWFRN
jgi:hypothetical protein